MSKVLPKFYKLPVLILCVRPQEADIAHCKMFVIPFFVSMFGLEKVLTVTHQRSVVSSVIKQVLFK